MPTDAPLDTPEALREILAQQQVSLAQCIESGEHDVRFEAFPLEPGVRVCHEITGKRYALGSFRLKHFLLVGAHGVFMTPQGKVLLEQNGETRVEDSFTLVSRDAHLDTVPQLGEVVSLVSGASYNFYHWTIDSLPKVIVAEACGFRGTYVVPSRAMNSRCIESLSLLGIPRERILPMEYPMAYAQELWIPTHFHGHLMEDSPVLHRLFRDLMVKAASALPIPNAERLYVRRAPSLRARVVVNDDELSAVLAEYGFRIFTMEDKTYREQIALASRSNFLLGPHGAGMLHSLWMEPGSTVVELMPSNYQNPCMSVHSRLLGHRYMPWIVEQSDEALRLTVDCKALRASLDRWTSFPPIRMGNDC